MKNTIPNEKHTRKNESRLSDKEEHRRDLEDRIMEIIQLEQQKEKTKYEKMRAV